VRRRAVPLACCVALLLAGRGSRAGTAVEADELERRVGEVEQALEGIEALTADE
jgi:hypothetical protein